MEGLKLAKCDYCGQVADFLVYAASHGYNGGAFLCARHAVKVINETYNLKNRANSMKGNTFAQVYKDHQ